MSIEQNTKILASDVVNSLSEKAPTSHASSAKTYGIGTGSNYGHVKLSDSTSSTSAASSGIAASPKAVKAAYDLANGKQDKLGYTPVKTVNGTAPDTTGNVSISAFPSGTKMLFNQAAAPTGWTKQTSVNDSTLRVVSGDTGGGTGGSIAFSNLFASGKSVSLSGNVGATTLTVAQMPSHNHSTNIPITAGSGSKTYTGAYHEFSGYWSTNSTGGSGSHTHSLGGSAKVDLSVKYTDVIICSKS